MTSQTKIDQLQSWANNHSPVSGDEKKFSWVALYPIWETLISKGFPQVEACRMMMDRGAGFDDPERAQQQFNQIKARRLRAAAKRKGRVSK